MTFLKVRSVRGRKPYILYSEQRSTEICKSLFFSMLPWSLNVTIKSQLFKQPRMIFFHRLITFLKVRSVTLAQSFQSDSSSCHVMSLICPQKFEENNIRAYMSPLFHNQVIFLASQQSHSSTLISSSSWRRNNMLLLTFYP